MPQLRKAEKIVAHLRKRVDGERHWVFVTEGDRGHSFLAGGLNAMLHQGTPQREMGWGSFNFRNLPTATNVDIHFLTIPKSRMSREDFACILRESGLVSAADPVDVTDLVVVGGDSSPELVSGILEAILMGHAIPVGDDGGPDGQFMDSPGPRPSVN